MHPRPDDEAPQLDFGAVAAEPPSRSARKELDAASPDGQVPGDTGGVVSADLSQAGPEPEASEIMPRE